MAVITAAVTLMSVSVDAAADAAYSTDTGASLSAGAGTTVYAAGQVDASPLSAVASIEVEAASYSGARSYEAAVVYFLGSGTLEAVTRTVPVYAAPTGTVDNIDDLPPNPPDGAVYEVLGTDPNRNHVMAIYSALEGGWIYQPVLLGRNTSALNYINPFYGVALSMPDFINFNGAPHTPQYWSISTLDTTMSASLVDIIDPTVQAIPGAFSVWRWKVEDLADPGSNPYSLSTWPETNGVGPSWQSKSFYRPLVKQTTKFNIKTNSSRTQRAVTFLPASVDHMWMEYPAGLSQPFTVIACGVIHSYPTAKFGHYILDTARETPIFDANKTGRDFFFNEGATPRNVMLYMKRSALLAVNNHPYTDLKNSAHVRVTHDYKSRPRMWYGLFNGDNSFIGSRDTQNTYHKTGRILDLSPHRYFGLGRRVDRVSDNRASHMSIWEIMIIGGALTRSEVNEVYEELSNYYQFKEYG